MEHWQITPEIVGRNPGLRHAVVQAMDAVRLGHHLLIEGEPGSGRRLLARCAWGRHGHGEDTMLTIDCQMFGADAVQSLLFGNPARTRRTDVETLTVPLSGGLLLLRADTLPQSTQLRLSTALRRNPTEDEPPRLQAMLICAVAPTEMLMTPGMTRVWVPPLRQRAEDIPELVDRFVRVISPYERVRLSSDLMERLSGYGWPENIAELRTVIRRLLMQPHHGRLGLSHLTSLICQDGRSLGLLTDIPPTERIVAMPALEERRPL
ncbi:MAG: sigma 54-interacting transcriptional regulator [Acidobacteriota bacterium]|nr:sigma 54-interacting transcriptional regulator [Acidobacteriota bacterium]